MSRNKSKEEVMSFLQDKKVSYPNAKENGKLSSHFNVSGIPAAAVVKDGKIVWRGHPARWMMQVEAGSTDPAEQALVHNREHRRKETVLDRLFFITFSAL